MPVLKYCAVTTKPTLAQSYLRGSLAAHLAAVESIGQASFNLATSWPKDTIFHAAICINTTYTKVKTKMSLTTGDLNSGIMLRWHTSCNIVPSSREPPVFFNLGCHPRIYLVRLLLSSGLYNFPRGLFFFLPWDRVFLYSQLASKPWTQVSHLLTQLIEELELSISAYHLFD